MSLINDALKRAQRQRAADEAGVAPPMPGGTAGRVAKRGKPLSAQSLLLIVVGATVLIVLSVVATVYLVRDTPPTHPATTNVATAPTAPATPTTDSTSATIQVPVPGAGLGLQKTTSLDSAPSLVVFVPSPAKPEPAAPAPTEPAPPVTTATLPPKEPVSTPTNSPPPAAHPVIPVRKTGTPDPTLPADERVNLFLDKLHVTGIRSSGNESKVLMNDRVYRVNDIVDRTLNLRLTQVQPGVLTFVDERGAIYIKNF